MPTFENYESSQVTKMIYLGHSGAGKTGSTVSLAAAGYNVRILDLDKGTEILKDYVMNPGSMYRKAKPGLWDQKLADSLPSRLTYVPVDETVLVNSQGYPVPKGDGWAKATKQLAEWKDGEASLGPLTSWTPKDVLVIDGLSRLADWAFAHQLAMNGRLGEGKRPEQSDYGASQAALKRLLGMLYSDAIKCNIIMICHIAAVELEGEPTRGFPQSIGKALGPQIGQFFNHALLAKQSGQGEGVKREIYTNTSGMVQLKSAAPLRVKSKYDLATGLAEYFADLRGASPGASPGAATAK